MKDEIKEKMEDISYKYTTNWLELHYKDVKMLYDYITNLQEENDYLKDIVSNTELSDEIKKADKWSKRELYKINYQRLQVNKRLREENERLKQENEKLKSKIDVVVNKQQFIEEKFDYKQRIDKAIEFIDKYCIDDEFYINLTYKEKAIIEVKKILQGSDK